MEPNRITVAGGNAFEKFAYATYGWPVVRSNERLTEPVSLGLKPAEPTVTHCDPSNFMTVRLYTSAFGVYATSGWPVMGLTARLRLIP